MGMGGLSDILGMGITVQLRNMFSAPALAIQNSSRNLTNAILNDQKRVSNGWQFMAAGGSMMLVGAGIIGTLVAVSKASLKASSDLEIFRNQIRIMAGSNDIGDALFQQLTQFAVKTPFTIPQVMAGAKNLMAFGFSANRVLEQLHIAGEWASMMQMPIDYAAMILGKVRSGGISQAMRFLQVRGIGYADILAEGGPIDPKTMRTKKGADPEVFLAALNKVIEKKFSGSMVKYMETLPGMWSNMVDQVILLGAGIGDRMKPRMKEVFKGILSVFQPELIKPFANALGDGLNLVLKLAGAIVKPFADLLVWVMKLSREHPNFVKFGTAALFITGTLISVAGAALVATGVFKLMFWVISAEKFVRIGQAIWAMAGPIGWIALAIGAFAVAWHYNLLGIQTIVSGWVNNLRLTFGALIELFTNIKDGVGTMSLQTADNLNKAGLLGITINLFKMFYRLYQVVCGMYDAVVVGAQILGFFGSVVFWLTSPIWGVVYAALKLGQVLGFIGGEIEVSAWKTFGQVLGAIALTMAVLKTVTWAWNVATTIAALITKVWNGNLFVLGARLVALSMWTKIVTAAQWLWNIAMAANPIGIVILAIGLLVTQIALAVTYADKISAWFHRIPMWAKIVMLLVAPFIIIPALIKTHWGAIKQFFVDLGAFLKGLWDGIVKWIVDKVLWVTDKLMKFLRWFKGAGSDLADSMKPSNDLTPAVAGMPQDTRKFDSLFKVSPAAQAANQNKFLDKLSLNVEGATKPVPPAPMFATTVLKLDSREIGRSVTRFQNHQNEDGRD